VRDIDSHIKRILAEIDHKNTIIVITADHGDLLGEHGLFGHPLELYEQLLHVPLLISLPPTLGLQPNRIKCVVQSIDLVPTILDLLSSANFAHLHGRSLVPLMKDNEHQYQNNYVISEVSREHLSVRRESWKAIFNYGKESKELYDLMNDPTEQMNKADQELSLLNDLEEIGLEHINKYRIDSAPSSKIGDDERIKAQLKALGYMD
jgi:arylsulfatase A-like enzyme